MQQGDVQATYSDYSLLNKWINLKLLLQLMWEFQNLLIVINTFIKFVKSSNLFINYIYYNKLLRLIFLII